MQSIWKQTNCQRKGDYIRLNHRNHLVMDILNPKWFLKHNNKIKDMFGYKLEVFLEVSFIWNIEFFFSIEKLLKTLLSLYPNRPQLICNYIVDSLCEKIKASCSLYLLRKHNCSPSQPSRKSLKSFCCATKKREVDNIIW